MQILFETALFCLAIIAPALLASSFKSDSAGAASRRNHAAGQTSASEYDFSGKPLHRWLAKRKPQAI